MTSPSEQLSAYLDGELSPEERASVDAALSEDPSLRAELDGLRQVVQWVREQGQVEAPMGFAEALDAKLAAEPDPRAGVLLWLRRPMGVPIEVLALAAVALWVTLNLAGPTTSSEPVAGRAVFDAPEEASEPAPTVEEAPPPPEAKGDGVLTRKMAAPAPVAAAAPAAAPHKSKEALQRPAEASKTVSSQPVDEEAEDAVAEAEPPPVEELQGQQAPAKGAATAPDLSAVPFAYTLSAENADVLRQLARLASKHGGQLQDERGRELAPEMMSAGTARVFVMLPNSQIGPFSRAMERLGMLNTTATQNFFPGRTVRLQVDVDFEPGSTRYQSGPGAEDEPPAEP